MSHGHRQGGHGGHGGGWLGLVPLIPGGRLFLMLMIVIVLWGCSTIYQ